jgi:hypothetical protein
MNHIDRDLEDGNRTGMIRAAENMDWTRVGLNGGPPCFHLQPDGRFCGRAQRWTGHEPGEVHKFVSLADLLRMEGL